MTRIQFNLHPSQIKEMLASKVNRVLEFHLAEKHDQHSHGNWASGQGDEPGGDPRASRLDAKQQRTYDASNESGKKGYLDMLERKGFLAPEKTAEIETPSSLEKLEATSKSGKPLGVGIQPIKAKPVPNPHAVVPAPFEEGGDLEAFKTLIRDTRKQNQPNFIIEKVTESLGSRNANPSVLPKAVDRAPDKISEESLDAMTDNQVKASAIKNQLILQDGQYLGVKSVQHVRQKAELFGLTDQLLTRGKDGLTELDRILRDEVPTHKERRPITDSENGYKPAVDGNGNIIYQQHPSYIYYDPKRGYALNVTVDEGTKAIVTIQVERPFNDRGTGPQDAINMVAESENRAPTRQIIKVDKYLKDRSRTSLSSPPNWVVDKYGNNSSDWPPSVRARLEERGKNA